MSYQDASLIHDELTIAYQFAAIDGTGEQRTASTNLTVDADRTATGRWPTVADNGTVYNGTTHVHPTPSHQTQTTTTQRG